MGLSEGAQIALINGLFLFAAALLASPLLLSIRKHAREGARSAASANEQVTNSHSTNLREENDSRHAESMGRFDSIDARLDVLENLPTIVEETTQQKRVRPRSFAPKETPNAIDPT